MLRHFAVHLDDTFKGFTLFPGLYLVYLESQYVRQYLSEGTRRKQLLSKEQWRHLLTNT